MKIIGRIWMALFLTLSAISGPLLAQAADQSTSTGTGGQKDETKMDAKGVTGSTSTQSGKTPSESADVAKDKKTGTAKSRSSTKSAKQNSSDSTKRDAKGVKGSTSTQSGAEPSTQ